jgi:hypothetical protein
MIHLALYIVSTIVVIWAVIAGIGVLILTWFVWVPLLLGGAALVSAKVDQSGAAIIFGMLFCLSIIGAWRQFHR